jgi:leucyl aminopeptidase
MKLKTTPSKIGATPKRYTRLVITEDAPDTHRFVERADGTTEYRMGVGKWNAVTPRTFRTIIRSAVRAAKAHKVEYLAVQFSNSSFPQLDTYGESWVMSTIVENLLLADYEYVAYKSKKQEYTLKEVLICGGLSKKSKEGFERGMVVGTYANKCRDIANTPGGDMTPSLLAAEAQKALRGTKAKVSILGPAEIKKLKMGCLLGVGQGAKDKPRFIVIEYWGSKNAGAPVKKSVHKQKRRNIDKDNPIVFIGKGITFDTGGLQVKPGMAMYEMHMDMSGGAAVICALGAIAKLGLKKNVIGLIPAAENAVSDAAIRPGDVLTSMSGKTVDVLNTDAEGRLVLADALHYAKRYNPRLMIDVATLTGAALVALGQHAHAVMTKDRKLEDRLRELGEQSGDYTAPLPLWDEYIQHTRGVHGDIANIPTNDTRFGGSINGGAFLSHFVGNTLWAHIDMAPRMTSILSDKLAKGATGEPVRLLVTLAENV